MTIKLIAQSILFSAIIFCLISCGNNAKKNENNPWAETTWVNLESESIAFRKPNHFKRSSKYRFKEDMVSIANDSFRLAFFQNALDNLEYDDSEVDLFIDTTTNFRIVTICNMAKMNIRKNDILAIKKSLSQRFKNLEVISENMKFSPIKATTKENQNHKLVKFSTLASHLIMEHQIRQNIYFLIGDSYTLIVYEFSDTENEIEKYLWSTKIR